MHELKTLGTRKHFSQPLGSAVGDDLETAHFDGN